MALGYALVNSTVAAYGWKIQESSSCVVHKARYLRLDTQPQRTPVKEWTKSKQAECVLLLCPLCGVTQTKDGHPTSKIQIRCESFYFKRFEREKNSLTDAPSHLGFS